MRLRHFCIGSVATQDLLVSKTFLPPSALDDDNDSDIQKVWSSFLDLLQNKHRWVPSSQSHPDHRRREYEKQGQRSEPRRLSVQKSAASGSGSIRATGTSSPLDANVSSSPSLGLTDDPYRHLARPLYARDGICFIYHTTNDLVFVACCPAPLSPTIASSTVLRIPSSLPGQRQGHHQSSTSTSLSSSRLGSPTPELVSSKLSASSSRPPDAQHLVQQQQIPELAFSVAPAVGLHISLHGIIEFLGQLVKALERYLLEPSGSGSGSTRKGTSAAGAQSTFTSSSSQSKSAVSRSAALSAKSVQSNIGIVYEILDECMELGYPMMPSLAQLDLLVFGVAKVS
ncbi:hypothetical protein BC939DRAFT_328829 [Gamsiella multidivaricata]|uniref:uncharacterized protein n=1 Tax=Gamsiella multidivaricata TaxID=101098 RepID=UPI00221F17CE|nr:uncharacterized protein BC939DRAFT_328829 [Gamsiella multidivaricata]KAG0368054.1 hypothetical protein BGZ54_002773 [Gamsiella multidivaricata]KAI7817492.1 hypothetical protein BC939DRAFT_328829 [Gamsiella multidivaricata]